MPGKKGQHKSKPYETISRSTKICPVTDCSICKRADKLRGEHLLKMCLFDVKGEPLGVHNLKYKEATKNVQDHTDYFRLHNLKQTSSVKDIFKFSTKEPALKSSQIGMLFQVRYLIINLLQNECKLSFYVVNVNH